VPWTFKNTKKTAMAYIINVKLENVRKCIKKCQIKNTLLLLLLLKYSKSKLLIKAFFIVIED